MKALVFAGMVTILLSGCHSSAVRTPPPDAEVEAFKGKPMPAIVSERIKRAQAHRNPPLRATRSTPVLPVQPVPLAPAR